MDLLRLTRPIDVVLFLAAAALGGALVLGSNAFSGEPLAQLLLAMGSAALVGAGSNVINDLYDVEIDRINKPDRPLARGSVSPRAAWIFWGGVSAAGVLLGSLVSPLHAAISLGSVALLWAYSAFLKGTVLLGNLAVGGVIALGVTFGGLAVGAPTPALWAGVALGSTIVFAREIVKDIEDAPGDRAGGARTLPLAWGERRATLLAVAIIAACLAAIPLAAQAVGASFYVWSAGLAACLLLSIWILGMALMSRVPFQTPARRASGWLKAALATGIIALVLARLG